MECLSTQGSQVQRSGLRGEGRSSEGSMDPGGNTQDQKWIRQQSRKQEAAGSEDGVLGDRQWSAHAPRPVWGRAAELLPDSRGPGEEGECRRPRSTSEDFRRAAAAAAHETGPGPF